MDLIKLIRQIDDLFYEVFAVIVFFPKTLWHLLLHPQRMMDYADTELGDVLNQQYEDTVSPPKFLMICLGIGYFSERSLGSGQIAAELPAWLQNWEILLTFRMLLFSVVPLVMALRLLAKQGLKLDRRTLRPPFYSQCYLIGVVQLGQIVLSGLGKKDLVAWEYLTACTAASVLWYAVHQVLWFRKKLEVGYLGAAVITLNSLLLAVIAIAGVLILAVIV